ncbi:MAG: tetratricopeptide repeat protein [Fibrella sp.]|nr:tetratricopeptide repeat protein [Armatimonadota bacterium]
MTEPWYIRLLGGLSAFQGEQVIERFPTQKTGGLLAYLAFYRGRSHPREVLLEQFWPDRALDKARGSLSVALNSLRSQFEPATTPGASPVGAFLIADRSTVRLQPDAFTTDVHAFIQVREAAARAATDAEAIDLLEQAERLYTGELLPGFYEDWVLAERERLADARLQMLHRLTTLLIQSGNLDRALEYAHRAVQAGPFDEESRRLLAHVHALIGRPATPKETSRDSVPQTPRLPEKEVEAVKSGGVISAPSSREQRRGGVPLRFTRFFGRADEVMRIRELFVEEEAGVVTLTGMGGVGKTRLSQETADRHRDHFTGGIFFAPLADLREPERLLDVVRDTLCLSNAGTAEPLSQIVGRVATAPGPCLLVLDNLEQLLGRGPFDSVGGAAMVRTLRDNVPALRLLITSRQPLGIEQEREFPVLPLPVPPPSQQSPEEVLRYAAVQLFVDRVQTRRVDFRVTSRNAVAVAALCARLDGVPLAIELVAARAKLFTPSQMLDRLKDGFALLESRHPDLPARHRSLRAVAEWSYDLLPPDERLLFSRLSIFRGNWSVEAAESICSAGDAAFAGRIMECLTRLRDASLLLAEAVPIGEGEEMRLRLPEPLREFAAGLLDTNENEKLGRYHTDYFVARAEAVIESLLGPEQSLWFDRLEADHDNFRSVLGRRRSDLRGDENGLRLASALARFWWTRGHAREGAQWMNLVIPADESDVSPQALSKAFSGAGGIAYALSDLAGAGAFFQNNLRLERKTGNAGGIGSALHNLGNVAYREGSYDTAWDLYHESLMIHRGLGKLWNVASALGSLGNIADAKGDYVQARALQEECLAIAQQLGDKRMAAYTLHNLGNLSCREGDSANARTRYEASMALTRVLGDQRHVATLLNSIGFLDLNVGNIDSAYILFSEALSILQKVGDRLNMIYSVEGVACYIAAKGGDPLRAARLWGASETAREVLNNPLWALERDQYETYKQAARSQVIPDETFTETWDAGRTLSLEDAVQIALEPTGPVEY